MIDNIQDLNKFVVTNNIEPASIIDKLAESKTLISAKMARLILIKLSPQKHNTQN